MLDIFYYRDSILNAESVSVLDLVDNYGSPLYIYSKAQIEKNWHSFNNAFADYPHLICYAVKANSNLAVLNLLANIGSGFDVVSRGELDRVITAGGEPASCIFSGVAKTVYEIKYALQVGIYSFNVESVSELERIEDVALKLRVKAPVSIRIKPDIKVNTHPHIATGFKQSKFGVDIDYVLGLYKKAFLSKHLKIKGIGYHIGSQITDIKPFVDALDKALKLITELKAHGIQIEHLDIGGGIGISYNGEKTISIKDYIQQVISKAKGIKIIVEPGRAIVGNAGIFVTKVEFLKFSSAKSFAIIDGAMNDLLRPALYNSYHKVLAVRQNSQGVKGKWDLVGPVCENADFLAKNRQLTLSQGDYVAIMSAGAYGFSMSSNYNSRPRVAEVMVSNKKHALIRERETIKDLFSKEHFINF